MRSALQDAQKAEQAYGELIEKVQSLTIQLQDTYLECFNFFERTEVERMQYMQQLMNTYAQQTADLGPQHSSIAQGLATVFSNSSTESDMSSFVTEKRTGNARPEWFVFEPYQSQFDQQVPMKSYGEPSPPGGGSSQPAYTRSSSGPSASSHNSASYTPPAASSSPSEGFRAVAVFEFEAQEKGELPFNEGDYLIVTDNSDEGWWLGYAEKQPSVRGMFPANYVNPC